ncbi:MAG: hypothetical protein ACT4O1_11940 [Gemmatimonadota bacterium]
MTNQWIIRGVASVMLAACHTTLAHAQVEEREKRAVSVKVLDAKALTTAILRAAEIGSADKPSFKVSSYSADSGVVRLFEEHLKVDTIDKAVSYSYYSSGCYGGIGTCTFNTAYRPAIVDDRGMVTTWRLVTFRAARDAEYRVLFERWEPETDGVTEPDKKETKRFYDELEGVLKAGNRRTDGGRLDRKGLEEAAARAKGGEGAVGVYELISVNGQSLPYPASTLGMISAGTYVLEPAGAFRSIITTSGGGRQNKGQYTLQGTSVILTGRSLGVGVGLIVAKLAGDTLAYSLTGQRYVFIKR